MLHAPSFMKQGYLYTKLSRASFRAQILLFGTTGVTVALGIMIVMLLDGLREKNLHDLQQRLKDLTVTTSLGIPATDSAELLAGAKTPKKLIESKLYQQLTERLKAVAHHNHISKPVTILAKNSDGRLTTIATTGDQSKIGQALLVPSIVDRAFSSREPHVSTTIDDQGQEWLISAAPILDSAGKIAALVVLENSTAELVEIRDQVLDIILLPAATVLIFLILSLLAIGFKLDHDMKRYLKEIEVTSGDVDKAARQLKSRSQSLTQRFSESAELLQRNKQSLAEINQMIHQTRDRSEESDKLSNTSVEESRRGQQALTEVKTAMEMLIRSGQSMRDFTQQSQEELQKVSEFVDRIDTSAGAIQDIIQRTKLLSFNASLEATRVGEKGKGFAVVAAEVSQLTESTNEAAKEIISCIQDTKKCLEEVASNSEHTRDQILHTLSNNEENSKSAIDTCNQHFTSIVSAQSNLSSAIRKIKELASEEGTYADRLVDMSDKISRNVEVNRLDIDDSTAVASKLAEVAHANRFTIKTFLADVDGDPPPVDDEKTS